MQTNVTIAEPYLNCVYQRDNNNVAQIPVIGFVPMGVKEVIATFTPLNVGTKVMQTIPVDSTGKYSGFVAVNGGWYTLTIKANDQIGQITKVGSGEVFAIYGHSFLSGGSDMSHQVPATNERVISLQDDMKTGAYVYGQLEQHIGPFQNFADSWGMLGDQLVENLNVPVLFYGAAYGGSNVQMNLDVIDNKELSQLPPGYPGPASRLPYASIERTFEYYIKKTGVRAVLFEHGYNDRGKDRSTYLGMLKRLIDTIRTRWNVADLAFVVVQEQLSRDAAGIVGWDLPTAQAQQDLISGGYKIFPGPDFNGSQWNGLFAEHDHPFGAAIDQFAIDWSKALGSDKLSKMTPYYSSDYRAKNVSIDGVLYNAPASVNGVDWLILGGLGLSLIGIFIYKSKYLIWAFLLLGLLAMARLNGKL